MAIRNGSSSPGMPLIRCALATREKDCVLCACPALCRLSRRAACWQLESWQSHPIREQALPSTCPGHATEFGLAASPKWRGFNGEYLERGIFRKSFHLNRTVLCVICVGEKSLEVGIAGILVGETCHLTLRAILAISHVDDQ